MSRLIQWIDNRFPLTATLKQHITEYYAPKNLNIFYYFGALALLVFLMQLFSGLWLTMFYIPSADHAFDSVESIMRDVDYGWLLRYMHSTGASCFFIVIYLHMFRALLYGSYQKPRELLWIIGMILYLLLTMEAFFGYLLPWGQMSFWGAQVITSLFGSLPFIGDSLATLLRGDYNVGNPTLQRFFALHTAGVPILFTIFIFIHIVDLHKVGSNNPDGVEIKDNLDEYGHPVDGILFHPYYTIKDFAGALFFLMGFFAIVFFFPDMGGFFLESSNFIKADPLSTPANIAPVWYLTPYYSMLRAIPNKLMGISVMGSAIAILIFVPWLDKSPVKSMRYKGIFSKLFLTGMVISFIILGYLGHHEVTPTLQTLAQICTFFYFAYFVFMPFYTRYEKTKTPPKRII